MVLKRTGQVAASAAAIFFTLTISAAAEPRFIIDEACRAKKINDCAAANREKFTNPCGGMICGPAQIREPELRTYCANAGAGYCVVTVDVPTSADMKALIEKSAAEQRAQWAVWLKVLQDTGIVKDPKS